MLDFRQFSVRQILKTFARIESYLSAHFKEEEISSPNFYLSTNARMIILEDLIDQYLGYLYDRNIKS
jgi:hypothetical protein